MVTVSNVHLLLALKALGELHEPPSKPSTSVVVVTMEANQLTLERVNGSHLLSTTIPAQGADGGAMLVDFKALRDCAYGDHSATTTFMGVKAGLMVMCKTPVTLEPVRFCDKFSEGYTRISLAKYLGTFSKSCGIHVDDLCYAYNFFSSVGSTNGTIRTEQSEDTKSYRMSSNDSGILLTFKAVAT